MNVSADSNTNIQLDGSCEKRGRSETLLSITSFPLLLYLNPIALRGSLATTLRWIRGHLLLRLRTGSQKVTKHLTGATHRREPILLDVALFSYNLQRSEASGHSWSTF